MDELELHFNKCCLPWCLKLKRARETEIKEKERNKQKEISLAETNIIKVTQTVMSSVHTGLYHTVSQNENVSS